MSDPVLDNLLGLANAYTLTQTVNPGANALTLTPATPGGGDLPQIVDNIVQTLVTSAPINLSFLLKNVRFLTAPITDDTPVGGLPIDDLLTPGITETDIGGKATPGVSGLVADVTGMIPLLVPTLQQTQLTVVVNVHWQIRDEFGNPATDVTTSLGGAAPSQSADIFQTVTTTLEPLVVSLIPSLVELTTQLTPVQQRTITCSVNLTAMAGATIRATTGWISLPPVTIVLPTVPIPTLAVFFSNNLSGHALVAVPANSPLAQATLISSLNTLSATLNSPAVSTLTSIASLLTGLENLITSLNSATHVYFKQADGESDLSNIELQHSSITDPAGMNADDDLSSVIFMAAPVRTLQCFNDSGFKTDEGQFTLATSLQNGLLVTIPDFRTMNADPIADLTINVKPNGWNGRLAHEVRSFNDELSSYRFVLLPSS